MKYLSLILTASFVFFIFPKTVFATTSKVIYKINKPLDQDSLEITSAKIYIDNLYTHHLDDEVVEFCDSCFCDDAKTIPCGFGLHTIKLIKTGYTDWFDQRNIILGETYEVTPILTKITLETPPNSTESSTQIDTSLPTSTQTPTPTPVKATYKIYKPKNQNSNPITSVKIYVDNQYTHHEDDEVLEFCDNCFCDSDKTIPCGFGEHTIKLTKTNFYDWSNTLTIVQGDTYETTPILTEIPAITSTPTTTITSTSSPTKTPTPTPKITPTKTPTLSITPNIEASTPAVLSATTSAEPASLSATIISITPTPSQIKSTPSSSKNFFFGGLFLAISSGSLLYFRQRRS